MTGDVRAAHDADLEIGRIAYGIAIDEYRFQMGLVWKRTVSFIGLSALLLVAGIFVADHQAEVLYGLGAAVALLGSPASVIQYGYYRAARNRLDSVEQYIGLPKPLSINSTATMGNRESTGFTVYRTLNLALGVFFFANTSLAITTILN